MKLVRRQKEKGQIDTKIFLTLCISIIAVIPIIIVSGLYYNSERKSIAGQAIVYEKQMLEGIDTDFKEISEQFKRVHYEATSQFVSLDMNKVNCYDLKTGELERIRIFEDALQSIRRTTPGVSNIYIIRREDIPTVYGSTYSFNKSKLLNQEWMKDTFVTSREWSVTDVHPADYLNFTVNSSRNTQVYSFVTGMVNGNFKGEFEYLLQVDMRADYIDKIFKNSILDKSDALYVFRQDGEAAVSYNEDAVTKKLVEKERDIAKRGGKEISITNKKGYIIAGQRIELMGMDIYKISKPYKMGNQHLLLLQILFLVLASLAVAAFIANRIISFFVRPFEALLTKTMVAIDDDQGLKKVEIKSRNSYVQVISDHFNGMVDKINKLIDAEIRQESEKKDLEMQMLQAQVSPHFLYNTLNSIKWLALMKGEKEIAQSIISLVELLEFCCKDTRNFVKVREEIHFLKNYIQIQKMRNNTYHIRIDFKLEEDIMDLPVIKFTLQPSVENAFIHAFPDHREDAYISISGYREGEKLIFVVQDNGIGYDTDIIEKNLTGIGIKNIDERIKMTFGEAYGQEIESRTGDGTKVTIVQKVTEDREG